MKVFLICVCVFAFLGQGLASPAGQKVGVSTPYSLQLNVDVHPAQDTTTDSRIWIDIAMDCGHWRHWGARPGSQKSAHFQQSTTINFSNVQLNYLNTHLIRVRRQNAAFGDDTVTSKIDCNFFGRKTCEKVQDDEKQASLFGSFLVFPEKGQMMASWSTNDPEIYKGIIARRLSVQDKTRRQDLYVSRYPRRSRIRC
eukprot:Nk52_evm2s726 gene=Nk52_evmTU2s726